MNAKIILLLLISFVLAGCQIETQINKVPEFNENAQNSKNSIVQADIKEALKEWSEELPTSYTLEEIRSHCKDGPANNCYPSKILDIIDIEKGYTRYFSGQGRGYGSVYEFSDANRAKEQFDATINEIENNRGYTEIPVSGQCFGWRGDSGYGFPQIVCYTGNVIYHLQSTSIEISDLKEYTQKLGVKLV